MMKANKNKKVLLPFKILLFLLIVAFSLYIIGNIFFPSIAIKVFQFRTYIIVSDSMDPTIERGDIIIIRNTDLSTLEANDIISFYVDADLNGKEEVVTHYLYSIEINDEGDREYKTIRENSETPDSWVLDDSEIIGKYISKIPKIGKIFLFVQSSIGRFVVINNALIIIMIIYLLKKRPEYNKEKKQVL